MVSGTTHVHVHVCVLTTDSQFPVFPAPADMFLGKLLINFNAEHSIATVSKGKRHLCIVPFYIKC